MSACKRTAQACRGVTILELMIAVSVLAAIIAAVYETAIVGLRTASADDQRESLRVQLVRAVDLLTREAQLTSHVDHAQDQQFQLDADLDGDGTTENNINYQVTGGQFQRTYNGTTVTLVSNLSALDFDYVDLTGAAMSTPVGSGSRDDIRILQITMTAATGAESVSLTAAAYLGNNS